MKPISAALKAHLAQPYQTTCTCWKVTLTNGTVKGFTDHDVDLVVSGVTYLAATGYTASAIETSSALNVDNSEVAGILNSPAITEQELMSGIWDYASVDIFLVNYIDLTMGVLDLRKGTLGEVREGRWAFQAQILGLMEAYQQTFGRLYGVECDADFGDTRCKVRILPPTWLPITAYSSTTVDGDASVGSMVSPSSYNGRFFVCTTSGTSGATEPAWNTSIGATTSDGSVVWTAVAALTQHGTVTSVTDTHTFTDSGRTETTPQVSAAITGITKALPGVVTAPGYPFAERASVIISGVVGMVEVNGGIFGVTKQDANKFAINLDTTNAHTYTSGGTATLVDTGFFGYGVLTWLTSLNGNAGLQQDVRRYLNGGTFILALPAPYAIAPGDTYSVSRGCNKLDTTCNLTYHNIKNFRGFNRVPGSDKLYQVGVQTQPPPPNA